MHFSVGQETGEISVGVRSIWYSDTTVWYFVNCGYCEKTESDTSTTIWWSILSSVLTSPPLSCIIMNNPTKTWQQIWEMSGGTRVLTKSKLIDKHLTPPPLPRHKKCPPCRLLIDNLILRPNLTLDDGHLLQRFSRKVFTSLENNRLGRR